MLWRNKTMFPCKTRKVLHIAKYDGKRKFLTFTKSIISKRIQFYRILAQYMHILINGMITKREHINISMSDYSD